MKRLLYACLSLATLLAVLAVPRAGVAQGLTNLNLDSWVTRGNVEKPVNWLTLDDDEAFYNQQPTGTYNFGLTTKTTDAHGGAFAARIATGTITIGTQSGLAAGELILGAKTGAYPRNFLGYALGGSPLAGRPTSMSFYYKSNVPAADSALALVYFSNTVSGAPVLVGYGLQFLAPAASYTANTVPITYDPANTATPDSVHIVFTSGIGGLITSGAALQVDDISFQGIALAARADADVQELLTVSPNPSPNGRFVVNSASRPELAGSPLRVLDLAGRTVLQQAAQSSPAGRRELDLSDLRAGLYLLRLDTKQGAIVRPLTVK